MRNNKKGFTIVELVIVIAVIAILAAVLIPTFSGVITKAQDSAALQKAAGAHKVLLAELVDEKNTDLSDDGTWYFIVDGRWFTLENGVVVKSDTTSGAVVAADGDKLYSKSASDPLPTSLTNANNVSVIEKSDLSGVLVWLDIKE